VGQNKEWTIYLNFYISKDALGFSQKKGEDIVSWLVAVWNTRIKISIIMVTTRELDNYIWGRQEVTE
jgi:hypothetical protein